MILKVGLIQYFQIFPHVFKSLFITVTGEADGKILNQEAVDGGIIICVISDHESVVIQLLTFIWILFALIELIGHNMSETDIVR